jgi:nondiscriminating aspartyl-tRNA synthetase
LKNIREASLFPSDPKRIAANRIKASLVFGAENIRNEIVHMLRKKEIEFRHLIHEPTPTSEDSARVRQTTLQQGIKAIILRGKNSKKNYQFNVSSHQKLDMKAVSEAVNEKCEFEEPDVIRERFGLIVGGVPPFGPLLNLDTFFDEAIEKQEEIAFNCGLATESIVMKAKDLIAVVAPKIGHFAK